MHLIKRNNTLHPNSPKRVRPHIGLIQSDYGAYQADYRTEGASWINGWPGYGNSHWLEIMRDMNGSDRQLAKGSTVRFGVGDIDGRIIGSLSVLNDVQLSYESPRDNPFDPFIVASLGIYHYLNGYDPIDGKPFEFEVERIFGAVTPVIIEAPKQFPDSLWN